MRCPSCHADYPRGTVQCLECRIDLKSDSQGLEEGILFVQVMELKKNTDVTLVKRVLNSNGIPHYVQGEYLNAIEPEEFPAVLMVQSDRLSDAKTLLSRTRIGLP